MGDTTTDEVKDPAEQEDTDTSEKSDDTADNKGDDGADKGEADKPDTDKVDDKKSDKQPDKAEDEEPKVRSRKTPKDFIIERKQRQLERAKREREADEGGDDNDDVAEEDERVITKVLNKHLVPALKPFLQKTADEEDEREVSDFLSKPENADFKPYADRVRRDMKHPSRAQIPVDELFFAAAGRDLLKIGAQKSRKADEKAAKGTSGGSQSAGDKQKGNAWEMNKDEFEAKRQEILRTRR